MSAGAMSIVTAIPNGMYELHTPSASPRSAGAAAEKINAAIDTVAARKPAPSTTREATSHPSDGASAPATPPIKSSPRPTREKRNAAKGSAARTHGTAEVEG